jgi:hypothetical protein
MEDQMVEKEEKMSDETVIRRPVVEQIDDVLYADGWEDCLIGHGNIFHGNEGPKIVAIYDRQKMVNRLADEMMRDSDGSDPDVDHWSDADEYISFNVEGAYIQPGMPVFATIQAQPIVLSESGDLDLDPS